MSDEKLVVLLEGRVNDFIKAMERAERLGTRSYQSMRRGSQSATRQMEADMNRSTRSINQALAATSGKIGAFSKAFAGGIIGGVATAAFAGLTTNIAGTVKGVAQLGNEARRAGVSVQAFQEWAFVADQNRISVDALVDGFKELNLRADEFVVTGKGSAAEAFTRLGFRAEDLKRKLADPSALMLEIIGRLERFDKAAQIRIADEIFGGTGGERFVELLGQGEGALRATIDRAHEAGAVLDAELIAKAEEIDRRFAQLAGSAANFAKRLVVGLVAAGAELADFRARLDALVSESEGRAIFGDEVYDALNTNRDLLDQNAEAAATLTQQYGRLADEATTAGVNLAAAIGAMDSLGHDQTADDLRAIYAELQELIGQWHDNEIAADDFAEGLGNVERAASDAFATLSDGDRTSFGQVIGQLQRLGGVIASVTSLADSLRGALAAAAGVDPGSRGMQAKRDRHAAEQASMDSLNAQREALDGFTAAETARNSATAEQLRLQREIEAVAKRAGESGTTLTGQQAEAFARASLAGEDARRDTGKAGGGSAKSAGGGGGSASPDEFAREVEAIRERTRALEAEAASLVMVAESGTRYGDAVEYARKRAELLNAAQNAGKQITPELTAQIDALAQAYVTAGQNAEQAAETLDRIREQSERGKDALASMFGSILDGSKSAKQAVAALLMEIAKAQLMKGIFGLFGGGAATGLGGLLGFSSGGYTGSGPKDRIAGVVHGGEYVFSKGAVDRIGVGALESLHRGTPSPARAMPAAPAAQQVAAGRQVVDVDVKVSVDDDGRLQAFVDKRVRGGIQQAAPQIVGRSVTATQQSMRKSKAGWGI